MGKNKGFLIKFPTGKKNMYF